LFSISGIAFINVKWENLYYSSSIGGGLLFHFLTDSHIHNAGFEISFTRKYDDKFLLIFFINMSGTKPNKKSKRNFGN